MAVGVHVELSAKLVDLALKVGAERPDSAREHVDDGVLDLVLLDVQDATLERCNIIVDCLGGTDVWHLDLEAAGVMVLKLAVLLSLAGNVILEVGLVLVVLGQLVDESLIAAVAARNPLRTNDEYMLHYAAPSPVKTTPTVLTISLRS